jgi:hypothetical protein
MNLILKNSLTLLAVSAALLGAPVLRAQTFDVNINTASLAAQDGANAPFFLDFQLNYGSNPEPANTVTLSNFQFTGGSALGTATTSGLASGSLGSGVSLTANSSNQFNELFQVFSSSTTDIQFTATVSQNGPNGVTPTEFTTAIMDNSLGFPAQLFTTAPDTASLVTLNLGTGDTLGSVKSYTSLTSADGNTSVTGVTATITAIPEPSTTAAVFGCAALAIALLARRSSGFQILRGRLPAS